MKTKAPTPTLPVFADAERDLYTDLYRRMVTIRRVEDLIQELFLRGEVYGTTHLYSGQEAVAVGVSSVLEPRDWVAGTYRGHGHVLARGLDPQLLVDEMVGRATGTNGGRGGSMNVMARELGYIGSFGIVGATTGVAAGAALTAQRLGNGGIGVAYFGDGATNQGYFAETLNFAQVRKLPAVFICENNGYGEYTPFAQVTAGQISDRAATLGIFTQTVDGMRVWETRHAMRLAADHARKGKGPAFIQAITYRYVGHSRSDEGKYRPAGELDAWRTRDPLRQLRERLHASGLAESVLDGIDAEVSARLQHVRTAALAAPFPTPPADQPQFA